MICWLLPASGISGDMFLGALLDAGADLEQVRAAVEETGLPDWRLEARRVDVDGIAATKAEVITKDDATHRDASTLIDFVRRTGSPEVARLAEDAVRRIAEVEGRIHGKDPAEIHLHEIGGHDTIVDTVGVAAALHSLGVTQVYSSPLGVGGHRVKTAHGMLPAPAPATSHLLLGAKVIGIEAEAETVTPTGAALVQAAKTSFAPPPEMTLRAVGYGAGTKRFPERPNVLQVLIGETVISAGETSAVSEVEELRVLETNLDDVSGELLGYVIEEALDHGARDVWATPIHMKKGRPAHTLSLLVPQGECGQWTRWLLEQTGSLGVREVPVRRSAAPRSWSETEVEGQSIRVKHSPWGVKPEHDDVAAAARATGRTWREIRDLALRSFHGLP